MLQPSPCNSYSYVCFLALEQSLLLNDGWHTAHHLNPLRHWRDHPLSFLKAKEQYRNGRALVLRNIDDLEITYRLMKKEYDHLARCLIPIGDQIDMSLNEVADLLRTKTLKFTEADIQKKYPKSLKPTDRFVYLAFLSLAVYTFKTTITSDSFQGGNDVLPQAALPALCCQATDQSTPHKQAAIATRHCHPLRVLPVALCVMQIQTAHRSTRPIPSATRV